MASIVTFDGARGHLGDEWSADAESGGGTAFNDAARSLFSWGVISFAVSTAGLRIFSALQDRFGGTQHHPTREHMQVGRARRRRRR